MLLLPVSLHYDFPMFGKKLGCNTLYESTVFKPWDRLELLMPVLQ